MQPFIEITLTRNESEGAYAQSLKDYEKVQKFNAVWANVDSDEIHFAAGGHKYTFSTTLWSVSMKPIV